MGFTGKGVKVAVVDVGVSTNHPDLRDNIVMMNFLFLDGAP